VQQPEHKCVASPPGRAGPSLYSLLRGLTGLYARADQFTERQQKLLRLAAEGLLRSALSTPEKTDLTIHLGAALSDWERNWFLRALPPAPAHLLLAAAGNGRELKWLLEAGYDVDAFEPAAQHATALKRGASGRARAERGTFADLIAAVLQGEPTPLTAFASRRYAAVILGWGSFTHVLDPAERAALLRACIRLVGDGPVLASFWLRGKAEPASRARELGEQLGRRLSTLRGVVSTAPRGQVFRPHCGFAHEFTRDEIEELAAASGRRVAWGEQGFPHVTFVKLQET
jgi:hypothetical protein